VTTRDNTIVRYGQSRHSARGGRPRGEIEICQLLSGPYNHWVTKFQGKPVKRVKPKSKPDESLPKGELPTDVKHLQEELRKAKLHNKLLNAIIDIAEEQLKIDIRKKSGTKQ